MPDPADETQVAAALRAWAAGLDPAEAAVELLLRAFDGRFADPRQPWIRHSGGGRFWVDYDQLLDHTGPLSGGERRLLSVVHALATGAPVADIGGLLWGLDRHNLTLVLAALSHAAGGHEHHHVAGGRWQRTGAVVPWPPAPPLLSPA
jgi:hypothetical protein